MSRKRFTTEQVIHKLREAEVELAKGKNVSEACKQLGVTDQTYYRWRKEYGALKLDQAKRLKRVVADLTLDNAILKEAANPKF